MWMPLRRQKCHRLGEMDILRDQELKKKGGEKKKIQIRRGDEGDRNAETGREGERETKRESEPSAV